MITRALMIALAGAVLAAPAPGAAQKASAGPEAATPAELVATYDSVADTVLATKKAEWNVVQSILAATYNHAEGVFRQARGKLQAGKDARAEIEQLAALVAQLGNEGDAAVARVRKRLLDGGHHHHAGGEQQGVFDPGFVIVTRAAKKAFLGASAGLGKLGAGADASALEAQWKSVRVQFSELRRAAKH